MRTSPLSRRRRSGSSRPLVTFCMEWVPSYREAFYIHLDPVLESKGIDMEVIHGAPPASRRQRKDSVMPSWATFRPNREVSLRGREITWQPVFGDSRSSDLIVVQNEVALPFNYLAMAHRRIGGPLVAMWGHGAHFNKAEANAAAESLKARVNPFVDWFFAYTERSARIVSNHGLHEDKITVVNNSRVSDALGPHDDPDPEIAELVAQVAARSANTGWMVSALDQWKRLPFLIDTLDAVRALVPDFEFFVLGQGDEKTVENAAVTRPWLHALGPRFAADKAAIGALVDVTIQPGLIGLHAIDSFAFQTPMVTTEHPTHSHEFDYLIDGENSVVLHDGATAKDLGKAAASLLLDPSRLTLLKKGCAESASTYTIDAMVERFADGIEMALASR